MGKSSIDDEITDNDYLQMVRKKRDLNNQKLRDLGLLDIKKSMRINNRKNNSVVKASQSLKHKYYHYEGIVTRKARAPRRSLRQAKKSSDYKPSDNTQILGTYRSEDNRILNSKKRSNKRGTFKPKRRKFDLKDQINNKERNLMKHIAPENWIDDMRSYFKQIQQNSDNNVQRTMSVVEKLAHGLGVQHPSTKAYFLKNTNLSLGDDLKQILDEASEWVHDNGGDRGNGW
eukprot:CAMPEP_0184863522 /NCGR_PEP_ID=MMETSP0580-20130426/11399_1 /TAXON_ID=1118495 /ORGANISM="Dactyliosolen fragilissimus" /LENGTH=229 /DNA_ID=CAMNT_0027361893 /DNA_START=32 /DNA_END=718 /DNA_ORIENTATION=-